MSARFLRAVGAVTGTNSRQYHPTWKSHGIITSRTPVNGHRLVLVLLELSLLFYVVFIPQQPKMANNNTHKIGQRLMVNAIDDIAEKDPERTVCIMPETTDSSDSFVNLNFRQLAHAVNYMSWWIEKSFGRHNSSPQETLTYLGANDSRYLIIVMACNKTGYQVRWTTGIMNSVC